VWGAVDVEHRVEVADRRRCGGGRQQGDDGPCAEVVEQRGLHVDDVSHRHGRVWGRRRAGTSELTELGERQAMPFDIVVPGVHGGAVLGQPALRLGLGDGSGEAALASLREVDAERPGLTEQRLSEGDVGRSAGIWLALACLDMRDSV
jgi:hypothetical protein